MQEILYDHHTYYLHWWQKEGDEPYDQFCLPFAWMFIWILVKLVDNVYILIHVQLCCDCVLV